MVSSQNRAPVALFLSALLLSNHAINAKRAIVDMRTVQSMDDHVSQTQALVTQLEEALQGDQLVASQGHSQSSQGHSQWRGIKGLEDDCESLKEGFERRTAKFKTMKSSSSASDGGHMSSFKYYARTVLRTRKLAGTLQKAKYLECAWVTDGSVTKSTSENFKDYGANVPCANEFRAKLKASESGSDEDKSRAVKEIIATLQSGSTDCNPMTTKSEATSEEDRQKLQTMEKLQKAKLELEDLDQDGLPTIIRPDGKPVRWKIAPVSVAEVAQSHHLSSLQSEVLDLNTETGFAILGAIVSFIIFAMLFFLFCMPTMALCVLILHAMYCAIKSVIRGLLGVKRVTRMVNGYEFGNEDPICGDQDIVGPVTFSVCAVTGLVVMLR